jgi:hypothetical protein
MARTAAELLKATRTTDYINRGLVTKTFDMRHVRALLTAQGRASPRQRHLPAHIVAYYVIALALFMQVSYRKVLRCLLEGLAWLLGPGEAVQVTGKSGLSQTRRRPGWQVMPQMRLQVGKPLALETTPGAWERRWRGVSLDSSNFEVADESRTSAPQRDWRHRSNGVAVRVLDYPLQGRPTPTRGSA